MATNPTLLTQPIAANGAKNVIPNTTSTAGAMSQDQGFPAETSLPLGAGGVAPSREDFNGAFNLLSGILYMAQKGWQFEFDESQDYFAGCIVRDTLDGKLYEAINDVSASSTHPSADSVNWKLGADMSAYTKTVDSPMFNKRDVITTSGTYTAPVTGWYKITVKGGGGGGQRGDVGSGNAYNSGGGGGEGGTTIAYEFMTAGDAAVITIGAGGVIANNGGDSSVIVNANTYVGGGGKVHYAMCGGAGGAGTIAGAAGGNGRFAYPADNTICGGVGGGTGGATYTYNGSNYVIVQAAANSGSGGVGGNASNTLIPSEGADGFASFEYFAAV